MASDSRLLNYSLTILDGWHGLELFQNLAHDHAALDHILLGFVEINAPILV